MDTSSARYRRIGAIAAFFAFVPAAVVTAHESHNTQCSETPLSAVNADIQSMGEGDAKAAAMSEARSAEEMLAKKDLKACAHTCITQGRFWKSR